MAEVRSMVAQTGEGQPAVTPARTMRQRLRWPLLILGPVLVMGISAWIWITGGRWV